MADPAPSIEFVREPLPEAPLPRGPEARADRSVAPSADAVREPQPGAAAFDPASKGRERRGPLRPEALTLTRARLSGAMLARTFRTIDMAAIALGALCLVSEGSVSVLLRRTVADGVPLLTGAVAAALALPALGAYRFGARERLPLHLARVAAAVGTAGLAALAAAHAFAPRQVGPAALWTTIVGGALLALHALAHRNVARWRRQGRLTPNVVVVGATDNARRLIEAALVRRDVAVLGIFDDRSSRAPSSLHGVPVLGDTRQLLEHRILPYVDRIVITVTAASQPRVRELITRLRVLPNALTLCLDIDDQAARAATLSRLSEAPLTRVAGMEADERRAGAKRVQDLVLGAAAALVAAPLMLAVAAAVRLDSPGPILFRQRRHGFNNEIITVWKFRSMRHEASDAHASRQVCYDDERVTRVGRFIRRTSLDELPQLLNVLRGEMSLVGPRPHAIGMKTRGEESARLVAEYAWRHRMKPGITGWAQINGSRGPVHTPEEVRRRVALDIDYIERQSFWFDLYILLMTLPCLFGDPKLVR